MTTKAVRFQIAKDRWPLISSQVQSVLPQANQLFENEPNWSVCKGGAFCLADTERELLYGVSLVGSPSPENISEYITCCQEKAFRLLSHGDASSWQTRDSDKKKWGGAIRCGLTIFSFSSGLSELEDEVIMLKVAQLFRRILKNPLGIGDPKILDYIAQKSNNPYWSRLRDFGQ
jgi:hypothetical protein